MSWPVNNVNVSYNNNEVRFMVINLYTETDENESIVLHNYNKIRKVECKEFKPIRRILVKHVMEKIFIV